MNKKYYFLSYFLEAGGLQTICNTVTDRHPFLGMQDVQFKESKGGVAGVTFTTLISYNEINETEYSLFNDLKPKL